METDTKPERDCPRNLEAIRRQLFRAFGRAPSESDLAYALKCAGKIGFLTGEGK